MSQSFRLVPPSAPASTDKYVISTKSTAHPVTGTHDTFRHGLKSAAQSIDGANVSLLQARLEKWEQTQADLKQTMQRNNFGLGVPLRRAMELKIASYSPHHPHLLASTSSGLPLGGSHNLHLEILNGTDETIDACDFMAGASFNATTNEALDVHSVMERSRRM